MSFNFDKNIVNKILKQIFPIPENFGAGEIEGEKLFYQIKHKIKQIDDSIEVTRGLTKLVIVLPEQYNYVIKIPFNGHYYGKEFAFFKNANNDEDYSDYCLTEYLKYQQLKKEKLECFVAKTIYYKTINSTRIFIQEKIIPLEKSYSSFNPFEPPEPSERSKKIAHSLIDDNSDNYICFPDDIEWISNCIDIYGFKKTEDFFIYCSEYDSDILDDAHDGNYGYRKNGEPAILDYSNYNG